jgi:type II secretory pathway pseudopilin PulG
MKPFLLGDGRSPFRTAGFMLIEVLAVIAVLALLIIPALRFTSNAREKTYVTVDLNNLRQILQASALYNSENDEHMAHPTWGSSLTGPDGWAYATSQKYRSVPGATSFNAPSCQSRDVDSASFSNQLAFFKAGQVTQYLPDVKSAWCPKDAATRGSGQLRQLWLRRPQKVTSYCWTGNIGGYTGHPANLNGGTYKISDFLPRDWQMWEQSDSDSIYFNDAACDPAAPGPILSYRHTGLVKWWSSFAGTPGITGGAIVGRFGGSAQLVAWRHVYEVTHGRERPNEILNGPGYRY